MGTTGRVPSEAQDGAELGDTDTLTVRNSHEPGDITRLLVAGELDSMTAPALSGSMLRAVDSGDVIVDLCELTFIASAGLALLLEARERSAAAGFRLVLVVPRQHRAVRRPFELMGMAPLFTIVAPDEQRDSGGEGG